MRGVAFASLCAGIELLRAGHSTAALSELESAVRNARAARAADIPLELRRVLERLVVVARGARGLRGAAIALATRDIEPRMLEQLTSGQAIVVCEQLAVALAALRGAQ